MAVGGVGWDAAKKSPNFYWLRMEQWIRSPRISETRRIWLAFSPSTLATSSDGSARVPTRPASISAGHSFFRPMILDFDQILTQVRRERDARIARLRRDKKKFAAAKGRARRQDITALPRVKDVNYPLAMQEME